VTFDFSGPDSNGRMGTETGHCSRNSGIAGLRYAIEMTENIVSSFYEVLTMLLYWNTVDLINT